MQNIHIPYSFNFAILSKKGVTLYRILPERKYMGHLEVKFTMLNLWQEIKDNSYIGSG